MNEKKIFNFCFIITVFYNVFILTITALTNEYRLLLGLMVNLAFFTMLYDLHRSLQSVENKK